MLSSAIIFNPFEFNRQPRLNLALLDYQRLQDRSISATGLLPFPLMLAVGFLLEDIHLGDGLYRYHGICDSIQGNR